MVGLTGYVLFRSVVDFPHKNDYATRASIIVIALVLVQRHRADSSESSE